MIRIKRAYEPPARADGTRILVERLWPRGLSKERAKFDLWMKDLAPSAELRQWFAHDPRKWEEFKRRYGKELSAAPGPVGELKKRGARETVTLVYAARDEEHNSALFLREFLTRRAARS